MNSFSMPGHSALPMIEKTNSPGASINPDPIIVEEPDIMVNDFLSPTKLKDIAGMEDLDIVTMMEMVVNTTETTLGNFGIFLPNLKQLKLSNSVIPTVRDVGTSLSHLSVLWLSCCGLQDVDGIASMSNLSELYLSYNDISDISPISFLDNLQVLDLEGNKIDDHEQFDYLTLLTKLRTLTLAGNPICKMLNDIMQRTDYSSAEDNSDSISITQFPYRDLLIKKLPHIRYLDDERCINGASSQSSDQQLSIAASSHSQEDIDLITTAIKEGLISEEDTSILPIIETEQTSGPFKPGSARVSRPGTALSRATRNPESVMALLNSRARPQTALPAGRSSSSGQISMDTVLRKSAINAQRPGSSGSGEVSLEDESSILTFGEAICGNPIRALRSKKSSPSPVMSIFQNDEQKPATLRARPATATVFRQARFSTATNENRDDILQELKEWRTYHEDRVSVLGSTDIMKIDRGKDILLDSEDDDTDSVVEEVLDLDEVSGIQDDNNNNDIHKSKSDKMANTGSSTKQVSDNMEERIRLNNQFRGQMRSPPPKNLSPSSLSSSLSPRNSPVSPRSGVFSSSQFDSATVPVMVSVAKRFPDLY